MKEITKVFKIYTYNELSDKAKEKVKKWYLNNAVTTFTFSDYCNNDLKNLFDNEDLKVQYSLGYCQGDGLNIYGSIYAENIIDCLENHKEDARLKEFENILTDKEKRTILWYAKECGKIYLPENRRYCYSLSNKIDIEDEWIRMLEGAGWKNINCDVLKKFEKLIRNMFVKLCEEYEKNGYDFFMK